MSWSNEREQNAGVWSGLDQLASLPDWLNAATDPERVLPALALAIPELVSGALTISARLKRGDWIGVYTLTFGETHSSGPRVVVLRGTILPPDRLVPPGLTADPPAFGTVGWRSYLPALRIAFEMEPPDAALASLPILTDPDQARALLERSIRAAAPTYAGLRIEACVPTIMRYTPGSRCTILYRLSYPPARTRGHDWPEIVVAKTYKGGKGEHAYVGMRALWESPLRHIGGVTLAEPLAFLPDLNVLVQGPIREEETLQQTMESAARAHTPAARDALHGVVRQTAAGLAGLHRSALGIGPVRTWEMALAEVRSVADELADAVPSIADVAARLLAWLEARAAEHPADSRVTAHGTFRPGQVLISQGEIGFIDFDNWCQAEPALDLSLFFRRTKDIVLGAQKGDAPDGESSRATLLAMADTICAVFLSEYERQAPVSRQRIALWEALDLFKLVLHSWTKVKPERLKNSLFALERHLRSLTP